MKKTVVAVIMAVMLCMICVGAFASQERPVIKLDGFHFGTEEPGKDALATEGAWNLSAEGAVIGQLAGNPEDSRDIAEIKDNVITWTGSRGWLNLDVVKMVSYVNILEYKYLAFRAENTEDNTVEMAVIPTMTNSGGTKGTAEVTVNRPILLNSDGSKAKDCGWKVETRENAGTRGYLLLPAKKTVWVVIPMTARNIPVFEQDDKGCMQFVDDVAKNWADVEKGSGAHIVQLLFTGVSTNEEIQPTFDMSAAAYAAVTMCSAAAFVVLKKKRA